MNKLCDVEIPSCPDTDRAGRSIKYLRTSARSMSLAIKNSDGDDGGDFLQLRLKWAEEREKVDRDDDREVVVDFLSLTHPCRPGRVFLPPVNRWLHFAP